MALLAESDRIYLKIEGFVLIKFDEKQWSLVVLHHHLALIVQPPAV